MNVCLAYLVLGLQWPVGVQGMPAGIGGWSNEKNFMIH